MNVASARSQALAQTRRVTLGPQDVTVTRRADGSLLLRSPQPLGAYPEKLTERLEFWAAETPAQPFFAQRDVNGDWRTVTYEQALEFARRIGQSLLDRNLSAERPIVILSGNDIEHALLALGALYVGIPHAPISPAYSLMSGDFGKLRAIVDLLTPGLVFACDGGPFAKAIAAVAPDDAEVVVTRNAPESRAATRFADLTRPAPTKAVDAAHAAVGPDTIAKFLFTSGSTGVPKCVINTQAMWCANQVMLRQALAYFAEEPPVIVDWAPWHHTAGGNHDVGLVLYNGGTFYIDEGKPLPGAIEHTVKNLRDVAPTWYFNVPKGYEALLPYLRKDAELRRNFFSRLKVCWFAGAGIAQHVFDEIQELAIATCGERILFLTGFGSTETAPFALARTWATDNAANMGLPAAGMDLKLVPNEGKLEARVRGPNITPGYWRQPEFTAQAFDEEGFYRLGDAFKFADDKDPAQGLLFDGRIAEDFKLSTGTWVNVGPLRAGFVDHFAPYVRDVVLAGPDRNQIGALVFPDLAACRTLAPDIAADAPAESVLADARVRACFVERLKSLASKNPGSSTRIARALLMAEPPSLDKGEMTDKGSINQRSVLSHRAPLVEELYAPAASPRVFTTEE
ncbi:MAG TPA: feruloyl-CoA synthase [Pseudolabrys sp.]|nr:feruloyl-CoA synthase [Pseudolabrys sp.]